MAISLRAFFEVQDKGTATLRKIARSAESLSTASLKAEKSTSMLASGLKSATLAAGGLIGAAGLGGLVTAIVKTGADFDTQMAKVNAITGATTEQIAELRKEARRLGADTPFSAKQAGEGMEYLALAGWKTEAIIEAMPGMLDLALAGTLDLGRAADITSDTMQAFGLSADKATHAADVFAYAQANANTSVEQMGEAMTYLAPVANQLGWKLEESAASMMAVADSGIKGSKGGMAFASSLARLAKPTKAMSKTMEQYGIHFFDANGNMKSMPDVIKELETGFKGLTREQKTSQLATLFGAEAFKHWAVLLETGSEKLYGMTHALETADGKAAEMATTMRNNLNGRWNEFTSAVQEAFIALYEKFEPALRGLVVSATDIAGKLPKMFDEFVRIWPALKDGIIATTLALATLKVGITALTVIGTVSTLLKAYRAGTLAATMATYGLNAALLLNPMTWVVAGIAALVAAGVLLYRNWDMVKAKAIELWDSFSDFRGIALALLGPFWSLVGAGIELYRNWDTVKEKASDLWVGIKNAFATGVNFVVGHLNNLIKAMNSAFDVQLPDWLGGYSFKLNIPNIPEMAMDYSVTHRTMQEGRNRRNYDVDGSHYHGLDRVPYDGYFARLHKNEAVLNVKEAKEHRSGRGGGGGATVNISGNTFHIREEADIERVAYELAKML